MDILKQTTVAVMFFAGLTAALSTTWAGDPAKAKFWVENESVDLGTVVAGQSASATFVFHNDGDTEVRIIRAAPS